jgi:hypothetical protein
MAYFITQKFVTVSLNMLSKFFVSVVVMFPMCHAIFQALSRVDFYKKRLTSMLAEQKTTIEDLPSILVAIQDEARDYLSKCFYSELVNDNN